MSAYCDSKYKKVAASTTDTDGGVIIPDGDTIAVDSFIASGADPDIYVLLAFDYGGGSEKIFASTKGDVNIRFRTEFSMNQVTGDGVKKLQIIIVNDSQSQSPYIGGSFCAVGI